MFSERRPPLPPSFLFHLPIGISGDSLVFLRNFSDTLSSLSGGTHQPLLADMILSRMLAAEAPRLQSSSRRRQSTIRRVVLLSLG